MKLYTSLQCFCVISLIYMQVEIIAQIDKISKNNIFAFTLPPISTHNRYIFAHTF